MKKEYHLTISRKDRIYLVLFCSALLGWELCKKFFAFPVQNTMVIQQDEPDSCAMTMISTNQKLAKKVDAVSIRNEEIDPPPDPIREDQPIPHVAIMTASVDQLVGVGFSRRTAFTLKKYIAAGGRIHDEKKLMTIYGMDSLQLKAVLPYLVFPQTQDSISEEANLDSSYAPNSFPVFDLNTATADQLESLPGIGTKLSARILKFRNALGGFISVDQLLDCYGITDTCFENIKFRLTAGPGIHQFSINSIDARSFSHPYLPRKIMWMLGPYIKNHGPIKNESDLKHVFPPDTNWCRKLLPYINFR